MPNSYKPIIARATLAAAAGMALAACYTAAVKITGFMPRCMFKLITGLDCPGCGSQRSLAALAHGQLAMALHYNPLVLPTLLYLAICLARWILQDRTPRPLQRLYSAITSPAAIAIICLITILWWIVRNIAL